MAIFIQRSTVGTSRDRMTREYRSLLRTFGPKSPKALGWDNQSTQEAHFQALVREVKPGDELLDFGCGLGDLYGFLQRAHLKIDYKGIDMLSEMIDEAQQKYPQADFEVRDSLEDLEDNSHDYVLACGAFSYLLYDREGHLDYVRQHLGEFSRVARKGFSVDFINLDYNLRPSNGLFAIDLRGLQHLLRGFDFKIEESPLLEHFFAFVSLAS
jgi:ubiquinone/menaquinone biosynthesis C-methylase UbiE